MTVITNPYTVAASVPDVLAAAADVIDDRGWHRGNFVDLEAAAEVGITNAAVCAAGAIRVAGGVGPDDIEHAPHAEEVFAEWLADAGRSLSGSPIPYAVIAEWNDDPHQTAAQVTAALRTAAREVTSC